MRRIGEAREERMICMLIGGWSVKDVAIRFGVCERTVRAVRQRMCEKAERHAKLAMLKLLAGELKVAA